MVRKPIGNYLEYKKSKAVSVSGSRFPLLRNHGSLTQEYSNYFLNNSSSNRFDLRIRKGIAAFTKLADPVIKSAGIDISLSAPLIIGESALMTLHDEFDRVSSFLTNFRSIMIGSFNIE